MAIVSFERMKEIMRIPETAEILLIKPEKEIRFSLNLRTAKDKIICYDAFVVCHNNVLGPAKGGVRFSAAANLEETRKLAEIMTYKNALAGIPFGGGKSGIQFDPYKMDDFLRVAVVKEYVHMIRDELYSGSYIPAPDMGSSPQDMAIIYGETHKPETVTGKPVIIGGLPGRLQATGRGISIASKLGIENILKKKTNEAEITIQGFGNVGRWAALFLSAMGAKIIAISDAGGCVYNSGGLDIKALFSHCPSSRNTVAKFPKAEEIPPSELLSLETDVFIPAAIENTLTGAAASKLKAKMVVEGANDPTTLEGEKILSENGVHILPDFFANSGGVIASYVEWRNAKSGNQTSQEEVFEIIDSKIEKVFSQGVKTKKELKCSLREAFFSLSLEALIEGMKERMLI